MSILQSQISIVIFTVYFVSAWDEMKTKKNILFRFDVSSEVKFVNLFTKFKILLLIHYHFANKCTINNPVEK